MRMPPDRWQEVERLYHEALEYPECERPAFLQQACAGDDALRQEVESLLSQPSHAGQFLETPALDIAARKWAENQVRSLVWHQLSSYKVLSLLGAGGMGEVYEAQDTKLGRNVAIKILPSAFVHDPQRLSRFEREARMLASLNHPNIATIHGLEESDGVNYLVMELVAGQTLAERIRKGALPLEEALNIARQIAEALEAAHEKGVIHRDLKPANVKVTPEGRVKVLDFGLAKAFSGDDGQDLSQDPTFSEEGRILGTPAYMSPEQARGVAVDKRTDIWAFGCVLYEMLTGKMAFRGEAVTETIAAVLKQEPDWSQLPAATPPQIRTLLRWCLQKELKQRLRDVGDAHIAIDQVLSGAPEDVSYTPITPVGWRRLLPWGVGGLLFITLTLIAFLYSRQKLHASPKVVRSEILLHKDAIGNRSFALSPDGRQLALLAAGTDRVWRVWIRPLDSLEARPLPGTETTTQAPLFWSPDRRYVAFFASQTLKKIAVSGGPAQTLCTNHRVVGGSWNREGMIVFGQATGELMRVSANGRSPVPLTSLDRTRHEIRHLAPQFLPDGRHFVYLRLSSSPEDSGAYIGSIDSKPGEQNSKPLPKGRVVPVYVPSSGTGPGHMLFVRDDILWAQPFDPDRLEFSGQPVEIAKQVSAFSVAANIVVYRNAAGRFSQLIWMNRQGKVQGTPIKEPGSILALDLSPDARRAALSMVLPFDIFLYDFSRGTNMRFTFGSLSGGGCLVS